MRDMKPLAGRPSAMAMVQIAEELAKTANPAFCRLVLVDGCFEAAFSDLDQLPEGVHVTSLCVALAKNSKAVVAALSTKDQTAGDAAVLLNTSFLQDGVVISVDPGVAVEKVLSLVHISTSTTGSALFTRNLVLLGEGASLGLIEQERGADNGDQVNCVLQVALADGASLEHLRYQRSGLAVQAVTSLVADLGAKSQFDTFTLTAGTGFVRNQLFVRFNGDEAKANLGGLSLLRGTEHADTTLVVTHDSLNCESRELFKHVLDGEAHGVFQGKIIVAPGAQKTDGRMMSQTIMLAEGPSMDNKPELEIFADDVQCAHGCTCGELDDDLLFYLRARGLDAVEAEALMVQAFAGELTENLAQGPLAAHGEAIREGLVETVISWMKARARAA